VFTQGCHNLIISTDHQPLLGILNNKPLEKIHNPRIIRLKEKTLPYTFSVKYNQGKWHRAPDALSRSPQHIFLLDILEPFISEEDIEDSDEDYYAILALTEMEEDMCVSLEDISNATAADLKMTKLIDTIKSGFPSTQHLTDPDIRQFFNARNDLWVNRGVVMFKNRLVVPSALRGKLLQVLHSAHQGVDGMNARAANSIYWPGMNASIRQKREGCTVCNRIAPSQAREPLQLLPPPDYPFQQLCMDAFQVGRNHYFAAVDRFSNWLLVFHIRCDPASKHVIESLRTIFMTYGTPQQLFTDGGLPFQAQDVKEFLKNWKVQHTTSSAGYPQGNGRAELAVKTAKRMLQENTSNDGSLNTDKFCRALLQYRNTPVKHVGLSPSQILFHRNLRDSIPVDPVSLKPNQMWVIAAHRRETDFYKRNKSLCKTYNHTSRSLPALNIGTEVIIQDQGRFGKRWTKYGTVVDRVDRKYFVLVHGSGRVISKNRRFLRKAIPVSVEDTADYSTNEVIPESASPIDITANNNNATTAIGDEAQVTASGSQVTETANGDTSLRSDNHNQRSHDNVTIDKLPRMLQRILPYNKEGLCE
jgi:transposase InsO family protein